MARRSATNERYQKHTGPAGKTRKSAAAAKPKRSAGEAAKSKSGKSSGGSKREPIIVNPPTAEYKYWRKIWWILLGAAFVLTGGSWLLRSYADQAAIASVMLGMGYASIFTALYIDWTKLRKLRREWMEGGRKSADKLAAEKAKAEKAAAKSVASTDGGSEPSGSSTDKS